MRDDDCVAFLQWALPRLGLRWPGFRKVRRQVCRRIARRMAELEVGALRDYRARLAVDPAEWRVLERLCRVTISRFWRDRGTFEALEVRVLPAQAEAASREGRASLEVWSCGCASGEEPYSVAILWSERLAARFPGLRLAVIATDVDPHLLQRAGRAVYPEASVRELPHDLRRAALERTGADEVRVSVRHRAPVVRVRHDVRQPPPVQTVDVLLCRNLVFTYLGHEQQRRVGEWLVQTLRPGGALVLGGHERPPEGLGGIEPWIGKASIWRRS